MEDIKSFKEKIKTISCEFQIKTKMKNKSKFKNKTKIFRILLK